MPWVCAALDICRRNGEGRAPARGEERRAGIGDVGREEARRARVERVEPAGKLGSKDGKIGLGHHEEVGERGLARRLGKALDRRGAGHRIDQGDDPRQSQRVVEHRIGAERVKDRRRVGEPGGFDDDAAERLDVASLAPIDQAAQGPRQILPNRAAEAPAGQFDDAPVDKIDEVMVDRDLADLVDDDRGVGKRGGGERAAQQRRFAAAEKTGQHRHGHGLGFGHRVLNYRGDYRGPGVPAADRSTPAPARQAPPSKPCAI